MGKPITAQGVWEEFDIAIKLGKVPIPFGASGWAAAEIWEKMKSDLARYYGTIDVIEPFEILGEP